jgi:3-hydroxyacyl-CoA dehydrogenase
MIRECMNIVAQGIATAEDVDLAVKAGFGLRAPVYGVFEHTRAPCPSTTRRSRRGNWE